MSRLRDNELAVIRGLEDAREAFGRMPMEHGCDKVDFDRHVRAAQNIVAARVGARSFKKGDHVVKKQPVGFAAHE